MVVQSILMLAVIMLAVLFPGNWTRTLVTAAGAGLLIIGGYFGIAGVLVLGKNRTPYPQPRAGSELVQHGIYARVRHPLYTSGILASLGWARIWQSMASSVTALALIPFFQTKAHREDRWLHETFSGYADYMKRVPAFLPGRRRERT